MRSTKQTFEETKARINDILIERDSRLEVIAVKIAESKQAAKYAEDQMEKAAASENAKEYKIAKAARLDALAEAEMYETRKSCMNCAPLISEAEYTAIMEKLMNSLQAEEDAARDKLSALADQMKAVGEEFKNTVATGNELLHKLQYDVYGYRAGTRVKDGDMVTITRPEKQYDGSGTIMWAGVAANHYQASRR